ANISTLLDRLATLATQAASGETSDASRATLDLEFQDVLAEITRESTVAGLQTDTGFSVFVSNNGANGKITGTIAGASVDSLGLTGASLQTQADAEAAVATVANAVKLLGQAQSTIGVLQNRLQFAIGLAQSQVVNNRAA